MFALLLTGAESGVITTLVAVKYCLSNRIEVERNREHSHPELSVVTGTNQSKVGMEGLLSSIPVHGGDVVEFKLKRTNTSTLTRSVE